MTLNVGRDVNMAHQVGSDGAGDRAPARFGDGTLMRHYLRRSLAPTSLAGRMPTCPLAGSLVPGSGSAEGFTPALDGTVGSAISIAAVAHAADADLSPTARTAVEPVGGFGGLHAVAQRTGQRRATLA